MAVFDILAIQERDVYALIEISHKNVNLLTEALNKCQISVDKTVLKDVEIEECFLSFYQQLESLQKRLEEQYGSPSNPK